MKKGFAAFLMCTVMLLSGVSLSPFADYSLFAFEASAAVEIEGLELSEEDCTVYRDGGFELDARVYDAEGNTVTKGVKYKWFSSDKNEETISVASGGSKAYITGISEGNAIVTVTASYGSQYISASCMVSVVEPVESVSLNKTTLDLEVSDAVNLKATVAPAEATDKTVYWSSSKKSVATVSASGRVTAKKPGTAIITATTADGGYEASCIVSVTAPVTGIKINSEDMKVPVGETRTLTATLSPSNATNKNIIWKSSNETVATVSSKGTVKGKETGMAEISAISEDGGYKAVIEVTVIRPASSVSLNFSSITLGAGKKKTLEASVRPLTATDKTVKWKSNNKKVAKVSSDGVVTAVSAGTATITCTSRDGYASAKCKVTVSQPATGIKAKAEKVTVKIGTPKKLKVTVLPETASNKYVLWSTADAKIATVDSDGTVKGLKKGKVKITATTADGLHKADITVTVEKPVKSVSINKTTLTINVGKTSVLKASVKPSGASDKKVSWSSSDNDVLTVSSDGKVTAKSAGYAVVTCTTRDGKKKAQCSVLVKQPVTGVSIPRKATVDVGETLKLKADIKPSTASNGAVEWISGNEKIAKVTSKGVVKPLKTGKVKITVVTKDGGYKDTCTVTVVKEVKGISLSKEATLFLGETKTLKVKFSPSDATNKKLQWKSSKKSVAKVSADGVITPVKEGTAKITAISKDGSFKATCKVTVKTAFTSVKLSKTEISLDAGSTYNLKVKKKPADATEAITWKTSNKAVAVVNEDGVITAIGKGSAKITGKTEHGDKLVCKVTVNQPVTSVKISAKKAELYIGDTLNLTAKVRPSDADNKSFKWTTSDKSVATVKNGKVTPKAPGVVTITATAANGVKAQCKITVKKHVSSVALSEESISLFVGKTYTLIHDVAPIDATDKSVVWSTSDEAVATVENGVITAVGEGEAVITLTAVDGDITAECTVYCVASEDAE